MKSLLVTFLLVSSTSLPAQLQWRTAHTSPQPQRLHLCAHEGFGSLLCLSWRGLPDSETWEWTGSRWHQRHTTQSLSARQGPALAYDAARGVVVAFGGFGDNGISMADTWEWDGVDWAQRITTTAPPGRYVAGMAYDTQRARCVLYGGINASGHLADLWEWDGLGWTQVPTQSVWPPAGSPMLAYDRQRSRIVLCPNDIFAPLEVWEFDGATWTHRQPAVRPPGLVSGSIAYDPHRGRTVLYGGRTGWPMRANTRFLEWDGTQWHTTTPATPLGDRASIGFAYDANARRFVLTGGEVHADTWTFDPQTNVWTDTNTTAPLITRQVAHTGVDNTLVLDHDGTLLWHHATREFERLPGTLPPASQLGMTFDLARQQAVLLIVGSGGQAETWLWNLSTRTWGQALVASPPPLNGAMLAADIGRAGCVLFGGFDALGQPSNDTWLWNGAVWTQATPTTTPPARGGGAMAYDYATGTLVLVGGQTLSQVLLDDVWDWDSVNWTQRAIQTPGPLPSRFHALVTRSQGVSLVGGETPQPQPQAWRLQGAHWQPESALGLEPMVKVLVTHDPLRDEITIFSGTVSLGTVWPGNVQSGIWVLGLPRAQVTPFAGGCAGSSGRPTLMELAPPTVGNTTFGLRARNLPPLQPGLFTIGLMPQALQLSSACRLLVAPDVVVFRSGSATGDSNLAMPIPAVPGLAGVTLYVQAGALDPALTFALTPPLSVQVGW